MQTSARPCGRAIPEAYLQEPVAKEHWAREGWGYPHGVLPTAMPDGRRSRAIRVDPRESWTACDCRHRWERTAAGSLPDATQERGYCPGSQTAAAGADKTAWKQARMQAWELEREGWRNDPVAAARCAAARLPVRPSVRPFARPDPRLVARPAVRRAQPATLPVAQLVVLLAARPVERLVAGQPTVRLALKLTPVDAARFAWQSPPRAPPLPHEPPQLHEPIQSRVPLQPPLPPQPLHGPGVDPHQWHPAHAALPSPESARARPRNPGTWRHADWPRNKGSPHLPAFRIAHPVYCDLSSATLGRLFLSPFD